MAFNEKQRRSINIKTNLTFLSVIAIGISPFFTYLPLIFLGLTIVLLTIVYVLLYVYVQIWEYFEYEELRKL